MAQDRQRKWNWDLYEGKAKKEEDSHNVDLSEAEKEKLEELLERAIPLIEQVNNMYNQYRMGVERRPPIERRNNLDQIITSLQFMRKPSAAARFMVRQVVAKYLAYKDRWDRIITSIENGSDPQGYRHRARKIKA